ncbi:hypothetical protein EYF80_035718 [Liparis tanakae]|uniref:Uncharacterized protein n=1 Tax=Liparis tanakae TaxID=230148 RepID=A0A4Z2GKN9_9TELE|nr:hypothetical protein EYF80_035718 [Liparis tanakae]
MWMRRRLGFSTVSTMSLLLTSPTWIRPTSTANFIWIFLIGTGGLITPAGRTMEPAEDTILSPVAPEPAPAVTCCWTEEPGGGGGGGWESRSVSASEEVDPGGAETGFSLDISPWKQGGEERSPLSLTPGLQARASACYTKNIHCAEEEEKTKGERR